MAPRIEKNILYGCHSERSEESLFDRGNRREILRRAARLRMTILEEVAEFNTGIYPNANLILELHPQRTTLATLERRELSTPA
jgi:hypothetical protein